MAPHTWWEDFRDLMPAAATWAYFDHAAVAPLSGPARIAMDRVIEDAAANGAVHWKQWRRQVEEARRLGSRLIEADEQEIAVIHNTTEGIGIVAQGFPWKAGDNIVTLSSEFPSNIFPWV